MTTTHLPPFAQLLIHRCPCHTDHAVIALSLPVSIAPPLMEGVNIALTNLGWWLFGATWHCPDCGWAKVCREEKGWSTAIRDQARWVGIVLDGYAPNELAELRGVEPEPEETVAQRFTTAHTRRRA